MPHPTREAFVRWAVTTICCLAIAYPLSYAPVVRWERERGGSGMIDGSRLPAYRPIDRLIDNSPLGRPLFLWARLWGVEQDFRSAMFIRMVARDLR